MSKREHHGILGKRWSYSGDVDMLSYGGRFIRHVAARRYHVIEFTNMDDACGSDNEGKPPYVVELREIDLDACDVRGAAHSCGFDETDADGHIVWGRNAPAIANERVDDVALANGVKLASDSLGGITDGLGGIDGDSEDYATDCVFEMLPQVMKQAKDALADLTKLARE